MPGLDRVLDPTTGDYRDAPGGEYEETRTIATAVLHQIKGERARWWGDADAGSDLYLAKYKGTGRAGKLFAENAVAAALQPFVDAGDAADVEVVVEADARGRLQVAGSITDVQFGELALEEIASVGEV